MDISPFYYLIVFLLSFIGALLGVNFGGSMLLVMPALVGIGWNPVVALVSSRPAIVAQSLTGMWAFRDYRNIGLREHFMLLVGAVLGALVGLGILSQLKPEASKVVVVGLVIFLAILAMFQRLIYGRLALDKSYAIGPLSLISLFLTGFVPAIIGGIVGTGAGLVVVLSCLVLLRMNLQNASYAEKIVSLGHSFTVLISASFLGIADLKLSAVILFGVVCGAYIGAKITLQLNTKWMYGTIILISILVILKIIFN